MEEVIYGAVDLGGTGVKMALGSGQGTLKAEDKIPTNSHEGHEKVLQRIGRAVKDMQQKTGLVPKALGLAVPGTLDLLVGKSLFSPNFPGNWRDVPVRDILEKALSVPVYLLNDVRTATLGEYDYGWGKEANTMVFMALGTGLGGGVVADRKLHLGPIGSAGELGHMKVQQEGRLCGCGARGCLETLVSGPALTAEGIRLVLAGQAPKLQELVENDLNRLNPAVMGEAARQGENSVREVIRRMAGFLGNAIGNLAHVLHPDIVVIGGGLSGLGEMLLEPAREQMEKDICMMRPDSIRLEISRLGDQAGVKGALALARREGLLDQVRQDTHPGHS